MTLGSGILTSHFGSCEVGGTPVCRQGKPRRANCRGRRTPRRRAGRGDRTKADGPTDLLMPLAWNKCQDEQQAKGQVLSLILREPGSIRSLGDHSDRETPNDPGEGLLYSLRPTTSCVSTKPTGRAAKPPSSTTRVSISRPPNVVTPDTSA